MQIKKDVAFDYEIALEDGVTTQYPQTKIYDQSESLVTTLDLVHILKGRYNANYTYTGTDKLLKAHTIVYSDSGHTSENTTYKYGHENLEVVDYAVAGDQMDLVNAPNSTAITAIKTGLGTVPASGNWSTHSAADVKTAIEADDSKLDHLWETTEDDGGVRRFTSNALEEAPSTDLTAVQTVTDKLDTMLEADDANWKFTVDALQEVSVDLTTLEADVKRLLGLEHENCHFDNPTYDTDNNLLTTRIRTYTDAASVGTTSNVLATYNVVATFSAAGKFTTFQVKKA